MTNGNWLALCKHMEPDRWMATTAIHELSNLFEGLSQAVWVFTQAIMLDTVALSNLITFY